MNRNFILIPGILFLSMGQVYAQGSTKDTIEPIPTHLSLVRSAEARLQVKNIRDARRNLSQILDFYGAVIVSEDEQNGEERQQNILTIKVAPEKLEALLDKLSEQTVQIHQRKINTTNIAESYLETESGIGVKRQAQRRYDSIMQKATTIPEIILAENELRKVTEEIAVGEARLKLWREQETFASIKVNIFEETPNAQRADFGYKIQQSFSKGWVTFLKVAVIAAEYWVFGVVVLGLLIAWSIINAIFRKRSNSRAYTPMQYENRS
jgi:hypothetical protein